MQNNKCCINNSILVSVIIPVYNIEKYLRCCIDSVVNQSLSEIEIILVDDGSTDSSGCICDSYLESFPFIKVVHQKNQGVSMARNVGLRMARGKYVSFLDSDDWFDSDLLASLYNLASRNDVDFIVSGYVVEWLDSGIKEPIGVDEDFYYIKTDASFKNALVLIEEKSLSCGSIAKLYKTDILKKFNICFPINVSWCEDALFNLLFFEKSTSVMVSHIKGYHVRRESNLVSLTRRFVPDMFEIESQLYIKRLNCYNSLNIIDRRFLEFARKRYSLALMWCLSNLYKRDSVLCQKNRVLYIKLIFDELRNRTLISIVPKCRFNNFSLFLFRFCSFYLFDVLMYVMFKIRNLIK